MGRSKVNKRLSHSARAVRNHTGSHVALFCFLLSAIPASGMAGERPGAVALDPPTQSWFPEAPPLAPPREGRIEVSTVEGLVRVIEQAEPGQTILVADGHYLMPRYVEICADGVTLRGASGHRERVIIDGSQSRHRELIGVRGCSGVTIADLTIQNIQCNGFKINSETNVQNLTIYNCIIHNI